MYNINEGVINDVKCGFLYNVVDSFEGKLTSSEGVIIELEQLRNMQLILAILEVTVLILSLG